MFEYMLTGGKEDKKNTTMVSKDKIVEAMAKAEDDYFSMVGSYNRDTAMVFSLRYVKELLNSLIEDNETDAK